MSRLLIGAAILPLLVLVPGAGRAGFVADRCSADGGGSTESCRCVERELMTTSNARLLPIVQAIASGRAEDARTLILDLGPAERTSLQETLVRATADAGLRCGAVWQPKPISG